MDPLEVGLEYRVGFSGYCPDRLVSRNNENAAGGGGEKKDAIMEAASAAGAAGESRLHVDEQGGSDGSSYGSAPPPSMEENCGQPYEDIPAVDIHLHPAHPDTGECVKGIRHVVIFHVKLFLLLLVTSDEHISCNSTHLSSSFIPSFHPYFMHLHLDK